MEKIALGSIAIMRARESRALKEGIIPSLKTIKQLENMRALNKAMFEKIEHPLPMVTERGAELLGASKALKAEFPEISSALKHHAILQRNPDMRGIDPEMLRKIFLSNPRYNQSGVLGWKRRNQLEGLLEENIKQHIKRLLNESEYTSTTI